jgi:hypothetical protein
MRAENLKRASKAFELFLKHLRASHTDAIKCEDAFAELVIFTLLHDSAEIGWLLERAKEAAE